MKLQKKGCVTLPVCISSLGHCVNSEGLSKMGSDRGKNMGCCFWWGGVLDRGGQGCLLQSGIANVEYLVCTKERWAGTRVLLYFDFFPVWSFEENVAEKGWTKPCKSYRKEREEALLTQVDAQFAQQEAAAAAVPPAPAETENQVGHARLVEHVYHLEIQHSYGIYICIWPIKVHLIRGFTY